MRQSEAAVALVRRERDGRTHWLARWNPKWRAFHLVAGHRRPGESFRACLVRELAEELGLDEGPGYTASEEPRARLEFTAWSVSARTETRYTMEVFDVAPGDAALRSIALDPANRWLAAEEVRAGRTEDGEAVSPTMRSILSELRWDRN
jgi:8-oxo-dGTP pyrophosphatase MutT (NUDIX family)